MSGGGHRLANGNSVVVDVGRGVARQLVFSPRLSQNQVGIRNQFFTSKFTINVVLELPVAFSEYM